MKVVDCTKNKDERPFKLGDVFRINDNFYLLCHGAGNDGTKVMLVNLKTGRRWSNPKSVSMAHGGLTTTEMNTVAGGSYWEHMTNIKVVVGDCK